MAASYDSDDLRVLANALERHRAGDFSTAAQAYDALLSRHPGDRMLALGLGSARQDAGDFELARQVFVDLLARDPGDRPARVMLGNALLALGRDAAATAEFERVLAAEPEAAGALRGRARALAASERWGEAADAYDRLLQVLPDEPQALTELARVLARDGRPDDALAVLRRCRSTNPQSGAATELQIARLSRSAPVRLPDEFVARQFDEFAGSFDHQLCKILGYDAPQRLRRLLQPHLDTVPGEQRLLDVGCGTGLCGLALADVAAVIDGVDLSPEMLARCRRRGIYRNLWCGNAVEVLGGCGEIYDLAVAGDVLIYFGDPAALFLAVRARLRDDGLFAFTIEQWTGDGFDLSDALRYRHAVGYIRDRAAACGFVLLAQEDGTLRREGGRPVPGCAFVLRRSGGTDAA